MKSNIPAIILAGGASKRMGSPKVLLRIGKKALLEDQIKRLQKAGCAPIIVIMPPSPSQFASIQRGLKMLKGTVPFQKGDCPLLHGCIILPIDCPFVPVKVIREIASAASPACRQAWRHRNDTPDAVIPIYKPSHQKGHPIWISQRVIKKILQTPAKTGRLDKILSSKYNIKHISTSSKAILNNINTPKDWKTALKNFA